MNNLFEFIVGSENYRYTNASEDITMGGIIYKATAIYNKELSKDSLNDDAVVTMSMDLAPIPLFKEFNPSVNIYLKISNDSGIMLFFGRVGSVEFDLNNGEANVKLATMGGLMRSKIPTRTYGKNCSFELFDGGCALNKEQHKLVLLGSECKFGTDFMSIQADKIASKPLGYFAGGYAAFNKQYSYITVSLTNKIELMFPLKFENSSLITLYAGCDKTLSCCKSRFSNSINYGGFAFVPTKNPMTQGY